MATTKKPTTTKKPAAKKTAVVKAHRGMAHVPRGRRRPIGTPQLPRSPRRRPPNLQVEPRRLGDDRPRRRNTQLPANFFQMSPNARKQFIAVRAAKENRGMPMTAARRRRLMELRRRAQQRATPYTSSVGRQTPAQQKAARDRFNKMMEANKKMRANVFGRGRKPTQATQTPKVPTARKRPTGTPRGPQVTPKKRRFRFRGRRT